MRRKLQPRVLEMREQVVHTDKNVKPDEGFTVCNIKSWDF